MSNLAYERLHHNLKLMKLNIMDSILDNFLEIAARDGLSTIEILDRLLDQEMKSKQANALNLRMKKAGFPIEKTIEGFEFDFQPSIERSMINGLATLKFIANCENIVFLGPPGVGKTHLAVALGIQAIRAGYKAYFANAGALIEHLVEAKRQDRLEENIKRLAKFQLLIVDEIGYLPFSNEGSHAFFQLISKFYETRSIIFTSNKSYGQWGEVIGDHVIASAILDRILHHCTTVNIRGDSYRLKERRKQGIIPQILEK